MSLLELAKAMKTENRKPIVYGEEELVKLTEGRRKIYMNAVHVSGVVPRNKQFDIILKTIYGVSKIPFKESLLKGGSKYKLVKSDYSVEFLLELFKLLKAGKYDTVTFMMSNDYPLIVRTDDFDFVLAPRIDNGEVNER